MITPILIQIMFWFGVLVCIGQGLRLIATSFDVAGTDMIPFDERVTRVPGGGDRPNIKETAKRTFSFGMFAFGVGIIVMGPLFVRLYCELLIIIFKIHDELKTSNDRQRYRT